MKHVKRLLTGAVVLGVPLALMFVLPKVAIAVTYSLLIGMVFYVSSGDSAP